MGVRKFFPNLVTKYKKVGFVFSKKEIQHDMTGTVVEKISGHKDDILRANELYLDTNCLIHPVCFRVYYENKSLLYSNPQRLEKLMIIEVVKYIELLIGIVNPNSLVYISIDGVAPMAKMKQQKTRRFKSVFEHKMREQVAKKYNLEYVYPWNNSAITPGTEFMDKLTDGIMNYLYTKKERENKGIKYIFDSAYSPGEGEHKILQYIKRQSEDAIRVVYGLDADLLYLTMATQKPYLYLIREITEFQNMKSDDGFCYVSVDLMKECIYRDMTENLIMENVAEQTPFENLDMYKREFIQDYIFFGFMIGNDFLPHLPSVHLEFNGKYSGLNILINTYKSVFGDINNGKSSDYEFLVTYNDKKITISYEFIKLLFHELSCQEEYFFKDTYKFKRRYKPGNMELTSYDEEITKIENMEFYVPDLFNLGNRDCKHIDCKQKFYAYYGMTDILNDITKDYFQGLYWNAYYYIDDCQDKLWYFQYKKIPFASDIYFWLINNEETFNELFNVYPKPTINMMTPIEQLFMVLPIQSSYLLPKPCRKLMLKNPEYYPENITLDLQGISKYWQAVPMEIRMMNLYKVQELFASIQFTNSERERNCCRLPHEIII